MDVPSALVPVSGISVDKKPVEELVVLSDADVPKVDDVPTPHQNGTSEKSPAENTTNTPITITGQPETVDGSSPPTPSANHDDGPESSTTIATNDDVKTVSLNNENDDRVDSIEVGGQGDTASVAAATSNSTPAPSTNDKSSCGDATNNGVAAVDDLKDLEQSIMAKESTDSDPVVEPEVVEEPPTTEILAASTEPESIIIKEDLKGGDNIADDAIEVATGNNNDKKSIVTENGQGDDLNKSSPSSVVVEEQLTKEIVVEAVEDTPALSPVEKTLTLVEEDFTNSEHPLTDTAIPESTDKKDPEIKPITDDITLEEKKSLESEESVQVIPVEDVPEEDSMMISNVQTVDQEDQPEPAEDDEEEPFGASLQLEDSQEEEGDFDVGEEEEDEDGVNQIETIDIDTDDEDEEGEDSLVGPPVNDEDDDVEEVESLGEEYEEFEVSDEENSQEQDLVEGSDIEEESISDGTSDDERFAQMKESNRGAKRKMYGSPTTKSAAKERRVGR